VHKDKSRKQQIVNQEDKGPASHRTSSEVTRPAVRDLFDMALADYKNGRMAQAERLFRELLAINPKVTSARINLGLTLFTQGKLADASSQFLHALELEPELAEAHLSLGNVYRAQNASDQAAAHYRQALSLKPEIAAAYSNLGGLSLDVNKPAEATIWFQQALAIKPDLAEAHNNLGNLLQTQGKFDNALICYTRALTIRPDDATVLNNLGNLLQAQGRIQESVAYYQCALRVKQIYPEAQIALGAALLQLGQIDQALTAAKSASLFPDNPSFPHYMLGVLLAKCGLREAAQAHFTACLNRDPKDRQGAALALASLGLAPPPERATPALLNRIYSSRAQSWDRASSGYRGAELVARTFARLVGDRRQLDVLDAGSGTGLVGTLVRPWARRLDGVDLSSEMCERAREKNIYETIEQDDLVDYMTGHPATYDVVTCAATFIHFGDLRRALEAAAATLRDHGLLVFTLLQNPDDDNEFAVGSLDGLAQGGCYVHGRKYIATLAAQLNFAVEALDSEIHEMRLDQPIMGLIVALRRLASAG
jgi:predicted TPR repeat methyltransferase